MSMIKMPLPIENSATTIAASPSSAHALLRFGIFELDMRSGELSKNGTRVRLQRQPARLLVLLADRAGELLTREELCAAVWGNETIVDFDQGLNFCVKQIRTALRDDAQSPRFVETLPRRGYRFIAPVTRADAGADMAKSEAIVSERSIAVLPFFDLSPHKDQGYFCEGIAEEILCSLRRVGSLRVASRSCASRLRSQGGDAREIGRALGVAAILDGSVRKASDQLRVNVELVDVRDGFQLWAEQFDRRIDDVFAIQEEIARNVALALEVTLSAQESGAIEQHATRDTAAYEAYLRGRQHYYSYNRRSMEFALEFFTRAMARDASFARAQAGIADCHAYLFMYAGRDPRNLEAALSAAQAALALDPQLAEAQASLGTALSLCGRHAEAEQAFEAAIRLDPQLFEARYFYARDCFARGQLERAAEQYQAAMQAWPDDYQTPLLVAQVYDDLGRQADAIAARRRGVVLVEERLRHNPEDIRALYMAANGLVALGERERGLAWAERAMLLDPSDPMLLYNVACIQSLAGECEAAITTIERSADAGLTQREWLDHDSNLDPLRGDPRFQALLARLPTSA
jgi:TolB-like protein/Flp pilus assembly protein TadD